MGKLRSNRVKRTPQTGITSDRYQFLKLEDTEPNLGDPRVGPSSVGANPIKLGTPYQLVSVSGHEGERFWTPAVGIGSTFGVISVYANSVLAGDDNRFMRIHGLDFVGTGVTIETPPVEFGDGVGVATVRFTVIDQKNVDTIGQVVYNSPSGLFEGADNLVYYNNNVGMGSTLPSVRLDVVGNGKFTGSVTAPSFLGTATTSVNVSGGIASVTSLTVSGFSTLGSVSGNNANFSGIVTSSGFIGNLTGNATSSTNVSGGTANVTSLVVSGNSTIGFLSGTDALYTGVVTATKFVVLEEVSLDTVTTVYLSVSGISTLGVATATSLNTQTLNVSGLSTFKGNVDFQGSIVGPSTITIDPATVGDNTGKVVIKGDLEVQGTQTTIDSTTLLVEDKNIELGVVDTPSDTTADGGGIVLKGASDHTILFENSSDSWKFSENVLPSITLSKDLGSSSFRWNNLYVNFIDSSNINASGVVTATTFVGALNGNANTATTATNVIGGIASVTSLNVSGTSTLGVMTATNGYYSGVVTSTTFYGNLIGNVTGTIDANAATATTATNVIGGIASVTSLNVSGITTLGFATATTLQTKSLIVSGVSTLGFINGSNAYFSGIVTASSFVTLGDTSLDNVSINNLNVTGITTLNNLNVTGISTLGVTSTTTLRAQTLNVSGVSTVGFLTGTNAYFSGIVTATRFVVLGDSSLDNLTLNNLNVTGITTLGVTSTTTFRAQALNVSGITTIGNLRVTPVGTGATVGGSGIVTYYGDGSQLTGITPSGGTTLTVYDNYPSSVGVVSAIDFGSNLTVSAVSAGLVTVTAASADTYWVKNASGIHTTSSVGIGTTTPTSALHVVGDVLVTGIVTAGQFTSSSDSTLKDILGNVESPVDKVMQMNGVNFKWKASGEKSIGVIAQEVEEILPELVTGVNGYKTVNYNGIIAVLIEAIKEQQSQIDDLKSRLDS